MVSRSSLLLSWNVGSFQIFQQNGVYKISYLISQIKIVYHVLI